MVIEINNWGLVNVMEQFSVSKLSQLWVIVMKGLQFKM
jgi:hypothetical protein